MSPVFWYLAVVLSDAMIAVPSLSLSISCTESSLNIGLNSPSAIFIDTL